MSDHWEEIGWDKEDLIRTSSHTNVSLTWYLDGQVAMIESSVNHHRANHRVAKSSSFLVPMHGGIWIMCVSLSGTSYGGFYNIILKLDAEIIFIWTFNTCLRFFLSIAFFIKYIKSSYQFIYQESMYINNDNENRFLIDRLIGIFNVLNTRVISVYIQNTSETISFFFIMSKTYLKFLNCVLRLHQ